MKTKMQMLGWLLFIVGLLIMISLSGSEYQWMRDMDPTITTLPQDNGNRAIVRGFIFSILMIIQLILCFSSSFRTGRIFSGVGFLLLIFTGWYSE
ncbi:hypothetical protein [Pseudenterobacter timonensis]|uniref:Uncharacterized protein n=1 Tax=Pseudenterobacter timonensis TaxID=1755099 RepID=A0ABV4A5Q6_9ENTR